MSYDIRELETEDFPKLLFQIEDSPEQLFIAGKLPPPEYKLLCIVGSRKHTPYGKDVCQKLISGLRGSNIVIVSGLALGIDSIAHTEALRAGLKTIAVPGSGLDPKVLYPRTHTRLAQKIIDSGGALLSEFENEFKATPYSFPQRNRIMAGMSHAVLIIEAEERSGTLITARLAMEYNREVFTVPGSILSKNSIGSNNLIKDGAVPITSSEEILNHLGISRVEIRKGRTDVSPKEQRVLDILNCPKTRTELLEELEMNISEANVLLSAMEIKGLIKESLGKIRVE